MEEEGLNHARGYLNRFVAFDSNALTYFLEGNCGQYKPLADDPVSDQRVAAVRLFMYCRGVVVPTVTAEALAITDPAKREEHLRFIAGQFIEFNPDDGQVRSIGRRAQELLRHHPKGVNDCRIVAEVEEDGDVPVMATWDKQLRSLGRHTRIRLETPIECWDSFNIRRGTPPVWSPAAGHPLANETWWKW